MTKQVNLITDMHILLDKVISPLQHNFESGPWKSERANWHSSHFAVTHAFILLYVSTGCLACVTLYHALMLSWNKLRSNHNPCCWS